MARPASSGRGEKSRNALYTGPNRPIWRIADILKAHRSQASWDQPVLLNRDFDGHYIAMAPGEKTKCLFLRRLTRAFGGSIAARSGSPSTVRSPRPCPRLGVQCWRRGFLLHGNCRQRAGGVFPVTPAGQVPSYPENETPTPVKGYVYEKTRITSTGGYDSSNMPFFNIDEYGASERAGERFLFDGHTSANARRDVAISELPPASDWAISTPIWLRPGSMFTAGSMC
jgi:hypothetical protein